MEILNKVFWKDIMDDDVIHFGYEYRLNGNMKTAGLIYSYLAFSLTIDNVAEMMGQEVFKRANSLQRGECEYIWIKAELAEEE